MNPNDIVERALHQAREMQKTVAAAVDQASTNMKPMLEESLKNGKELQESLGKYAAEAGTVAQEQTKSAMGHLQEFMRIGSEAMKSSSDIAAKQGQALLEQSRKTIESATAAMGKKPEDVATATKPEDPH